MINYVKSILFVTIGPVILVTCFFSNQIEIKDNYRKPSVEVSYVKGYDFSKTKMAFK